MIDQISTLATAIGVIVLSLFAFFAISTFIDYILWNRRSDQAKQVGTAMSKESGLGSTASAMLADMVLEEIEALSIERHIQHHEDPVAQLDWSVHDADSTDINVMTSALEDAGYFVHPFPRQRKGEWSRSHVGVWAREPTWYVEVEDEESGDAKRKEVTPDTD